MYVILLANACRDLRHSSRARPFSLHHLMAFKKNLCTAKTDTSLTFLGMAAFRVDPEMWCADGTLLTSHFTVGDGGKCAAN